MNLKDRNILLGVTGGIACYKACELVRNLKRLSACVTVIMTDAAKKFVSPLTFETLSAKKVYSDMFEMNEDSRSPHIEAGKEIDLIIIAPATANTIGKIANGTADNLLTAAVMASDAPVLVCPSMHTGMYKNPIVLENIEKLKKTGRYHFVDPDTGELASGDYGKGRFPEIKNIIEQVFFLTGDKILKNVRMVVTAGPTREFIDSVRFLSNPSTGKMGYAIARQAARHGAKVTLISGPTLLEPPCSDIKVINVVSADEMYDNVKKAVADADVLIMNAAVCDEKPLKRFKQKIKKDELPESISLVRTKDILKELKGCFKNKIVVGFSAETENVIINAGKKLKEKGLNLIFSNPVNEQSSGFASDLNRGYLIDSNGNSEKVDLMSKDELALKILHEVAKRLK